MENSEITLFNYTRALREAELAREVKYVLLLLATYMKPKTLHAWPFQKTLAREGGLSVRSVQRLLASAEKAGWIRKEPWRRGIGYHGTIPSPARKSETRQS